MIELKKLSINDGKDIYNLLQEMPKEENGLINKANGLSFEEFQAWLKAKQIESEQEGLVDGWKVPSTTFWLYVDGVPVVNDEFTDMHQGNKGICLCFLGSLNGNFYVI